MMIRKSNSTIAIMSRCGRTPDLLEVSSQDYVGSPTQKVADAQLVSVGGTLWGSGLWMNKLARQPSKLL